MGIKTIPLGRLEANLRATLAECADSGEAVVVELPDRRLVAISSLEAVGDDDLLDDLLQSNPEFQAMVARSKASPANRLCRRRKADHSTSRVQAPAFFDDSSGSRRITWFKSITVYRA
jgi:hypothetical protein